MAQPLVPRLELPFFADKRDFAVEVRASRLSHVQEVTRRLHGRIHRATTTFASANDLASAMRRAAAAHEKRNGQHEANWPDRYAAYMAAVQVGTELPK
jgi:hypothetical protein